jgi:SAM-dependent methyltransferase
MLELRKITDVSTGNSRSAYENIYQTAEIRHRGSFYRWILRLLAPKPGKRLLDVACGVGVLSNYAAVRGVSGFGVDFSEVAVRRGRREGAASFVVGDGEALPLADGSFDYATSIGSLEHYLDPLAGMREIRRVLAPHGVALFLLPNSYSILHNVWTAFRKGRTGQDLQPLERFAARLEWQDLIEQAGFSVCETHKYEQETPTEWDDFIWYARHPKRMLRLLLTPVVPLNWAHSFVYRCSVE